MRRATADRRTRGSNTPQPGGCAICEGSGTFARCPAPGQAPHREHGGRRMVERFRRSFKGKRGLVAAGIAVAALAGALAAIALPATTTKPYRAAIAVSAPVPPDTTPAA